MLERSSKRYLALLYVSDIIATLASLTLAHWLRLQLPLGKALTPLGTINLPIYVIVVAIWTISFLSFSAYNPKHIVGVLGEVQKVIVAIMVSWLVLAGVLFLTYRGLSRLLLGYFFVLDLCTVIFVRCLWRIIFKVLGPKQMPTHKVLIIGAGSVGQDLARKLSQRNWLGLEIVGYLDDNEAKIGRTLAGYEVLGPLDRATETIRAHDVDEAVIALPLWAHERMRELVTTMQELPVNIKVVPDFFALTFFSATMEDVDGIPLIGLKEPVIRGGARLAKRVMDLTLAVIALVILWPAMLLIALLIKLETKGPAIFVQQRAGENGRLFSMYKFRTMRVGAEKEEVNLLSETQDGHLFFDKRPDDPRVTRVGYYLRRMSLDELPQIFNVIKGEMSLVGPRPELPFLVERYEPWQRKRFEVPQGMTGWWQVNDRSDRPMYLSTEEDLYYIQNYSLLLDLKIMWRTIGAVLRGKGAY